MSNTSGPTETPRRVVPETRARQGRYGRHMLWVLLGGLFLVIAAFAALYVYHAENFANANVGNGPANVNSPAGPTRQTFNAPEPAPINPQPGAGHTAPGSNTRGP